MSRVVIPEELAEEVRDHPERFRPEFGSGDRVIPLALASDPEAFTTSFGMEGVEGRVMTTRPLPQGRIAVDFEDGRWSVATAWALVGSVDGGPRPEVGQRVLVLHGSKAAIGTVCRTGAPHAGTESPVYCVHDGRNLGYDATRWAILPPVAAEPASPALPGGSGDAEPGEDVSPRPLRNACPSVHPTELGVDCMSFEGHPGGSHAAVVDGETLVWVDEEIHESSPRRSLVEALMGDREVPPYVPRPAVATRSGKPVLRVYGDYIVWDTGECTCGAPGPNGEHTPECQLEPVVHVAELEALGFRLAPDDGHRSWRLGKHWTGHNALDPREARRELATIVESGIEPPDEDGRRPDDRLVGSLLRLDAEVVVYSVNLARREEAPTQFAYDAVCSTLAKHREEAERLDALLADLRAWLMTQRDELLETEPDDDTYPADSVAVGRLIGVLAWLDERNAP